MAARNVFRMGMFSQSRPQGAGRTRRASALEQRSIPLAQVEFNVAYHMSWLNKARAQHSSACNWCCVS